MMNINKRCTDLDVLGPRGRVRMHCFTKPLAACIQSQVSRGAL